MMDEVVIAGYKSSSAGNINNMPANDHAILKAECLRVVAGQIESSTSEFKKKDIEFALPFKFLLNKLYLFFIAGCVKVFFIFIFIPGLLVLPGYIIMIIV